MAQYDFLSASNGSGDAALMHITAPRITGATTILVDSVSNVPAKFIGTYGTLLATGFLDPSDKCDFRGHVSGSDLIIDAFEPGSVDVGNTTGQVVVIKPTTGWADRVATFIKNATGNGTPEDVTVDDAVVGGTLAVTGASTLGGAVTGAGYSVGTIANPYKFLVYRNAPWTAGSPIRIDFDTKVFDTSSSFDNVTNFVFTAPVAGFYHFSAAAEVADAGGSFAVIYFFKNGAVYSQGGGGVQGSTAGFGHGCSIAQTIQLSASDSIGVWFYGTGPGSGGSAPMKTFFSGHLVSKT